MSRRAHAPQSVLGRTALRSMLALPGLGFLLFAHTLYAATIAIPAPFDSVNFGRSVTYLPNNNIVVTDPSAGPSGVGAVYLYSPTGTLLSTLKGGTANDSIGNAGVVVLPSGNFLINSPDWQSGGLQRAGAVTFVNGTTGLSGTVSATNSLVGSFVGDSDNRQILVLNTGNYLVLSPRQDFPGASNRGAVSWGSGTTGVSGAISVANSLTSPNVGGMNGLSVAQLTNGNFVVGAPQWNSVGAAIWCPANSGCVGNVEDNIAMVGTTPGDSIGSGVTALTNGHYVVSSQFWDNGGAVDVGIATWADGSTGFDGSPTPANSWIGAAANHMIGNGRVTALANGNFVIISSFWPNGGALRAGAATWVSGISASSGVVDATNSIVGTTLDDQIGSSIEALPNGNYVVGSPNWNNGTAAGAGAARFASGIGPTVGAVTGANSLVGTTSGDSVGGLIEVLPSGNYVLRMPQWDNGAATDAGAVSFGSGTTGTAGPVSAANSFVGTSLSDEFGGYFRTLTNGNFLTGSSIWNNGATTDAGIVTWISGTAGGNGAVSGGNSLIGAATADRIGTELIALSNGNFMVLSRNWDGAGTDLGAVTWGNGTTGTSGFVNAANSFIGATNADGPPQMIGVPLSNGSAVISWPGFNIPGLNDVGALTHLGGAGPTPGTVAQATSFVGTSAGENLGSPIPEGYSDDTLVLKVPNWDIGIAPLNVGAVCLLDGRGIAGQVNTHLCVLGSLANLGSSMVADYSVSRKQMVVGVPFENKVVILDNNLFANGFE